MEPQVIWQGELGNDLHLDAPPAAIPDPSPEDDETWDEKVRAQLELAAAHPLDTFTLKFEFSETGLGYTKRLLVVLASDEEDALLQYRRHFEPTLDDGGWEYWCRGIDVQRGLHTEWLDRFLNPDWLERISKNLVYHRVIAFEWHFNAS